MPFTLKFKTDHGLCQTCVHSHITVDIRNQSEVTCNTTGYPRNVPVPVSDCSSFAVKGTQTLYQMQEKALILEKTKNRAGFITAAELKKKGIDVEDTYVVDPSTFVE